jgi:hypothetical protein
MALILKGPVESVENLVCDKLSFVLAYQTKAEQDAVAAGLEEIITYKMGSPYRKRPYKCGVKLYEPEVQNKLRMLAQWSPMHEGIPFARIDLNPSHADMFAIKATLLTAIPNWESDVSSLARVTRFDAAVDLVGVRSDELLAYYPSKQISQTYSKSSRMESYYIGKPGEDNFIAIYDKRLQIKEKNAKYGLKIPIPAFEITRVEIRMKPDCSFQCLLDMANPFEKLTLKTHQNFPKNDELWELFVATARYEGLQNALQRLNPATRLKFHKRIKDYPSVWWKPKEIWAAWPGLVTELWKSLGVDDF